MRIDPQKCIQCQVCIDYCPVGAIREVPETGQIYIDQKECVECGTCLRASDCPYEALWQPELKWPRILRAQFSDPAVVHPVTSVTGRGTEETKTNDVTGRYRRGFVGIAAELGRPGTGTSLEDVEKVARAILSLGVAFEKDNPTYNLFADLTTGRLREDVRGERVLSAILEFQTTVEKAPQLLAALKEVATEVDTVMSVDIASRLEPDGSLPAEQVARIAGLELRPNGKSNLGLGRPHAEIS